MLKPAPGSNLFDLKAGETSAHRFHFRFTSVVTLGAEDRKKSRRDMGELAGGSGRWWRSVRRSHGDLHHRDVAHNVIIKSLCIEGFSCIEVIRSPQEVCVVPIKGQIKIHLKLISPTPLNMKISQPYFSALVSIQTIIPHPAKQSDLLLCALIPEIPI